LQVPADFPLTFFQFCPDRVNVLWFFGEDRLADDVFHVSIGERYLDGKTGLKTFEARRGIKGGLTGANEEHATVKIGADVLGDFLDVIRA
jgi:hypothetical protein